MKTGAKNILVLAGMAGFAGLALVVAENDPRSRPIMTMLEPGIPPVYDSTCPSVSTNPQTNWPVRASTCITAGATNLPSGSRKITNP